MTNPGSLSLVNVTVTDDNGTPAIAGDDFAATFVGGDTNLNGLLDPDETWTYTATGTVGVAEYCNIGTASGANVGVTATATDTACYRVPPVPQPKIAIVKLVNGLDANDGATGPELVPGSTVTWTYLVTNPGSLSLANVTVIDDNGTPAIAGDDFAATFVGGDTNLNGLLDPDETWTYTATGTVGVAQYCNIGTASGANAGVTATATDTACYRVPPPPQIAIVKLVNGRDANTAADGPQLLSGSSVNWTYVVTNPGTVSLANVTVTDDNGTPAIAGDDFQAIFTGGDSNGNGLLDPNETWTYTATGTVGVAQYCNVGTASGANAGTTATASDAACYRVRPPEPPQVAIVKLVNGVDANAPASGPLLTPGASVTWTYVVTNPGTVSLANVTVTDDNGTPADRGRRLPGDLHGW